MSLITPRVFSGALARPVLQERRFRVELRCAECRHETTKIVELMDEPNDPATLDDFYATGVIDGMRFACETCGCESGVLIAMTYLNAPNEPRGGQ